MRIIDANFENEDGEELVRYGSRDVEGKGEVEVHVNWPILIAETLESVARILRKANLG